MIYESKTRSLLKACSWRFVASTATGVIVYLFTRQLVVAITVGAVEAVAKIAVFFVHERFWHLVRFGRHRAPGAVIWLTGFSGSGKSTVAEAVAASLRERGLKVQRLDGDTMRSILPTIGFSKKDRDDHIHRTGLLASILEKNGVVVLASFISPYQESRDFVRGLCHNFIEVHVSTPLAVCESRDTKQLYAKARRGEIKSFTGVDDPYEPPRAPEVTVDTSQVSLEEATRAIVERFDALPAEAVN